MSVFPPPQLHQRLAYRCRGHWHGGLNVFVHDPDFENEYVETWEMGTFTSLASAALWVLERES